MGLDIVIVDFVGGILDRVGDPQNLLHRLLPPASEESDSMLSKIDWYGDTYFNYLQMKRFLAEWDEMASRAHAPEEQAVVSGVRKLALRCQDDRGNVSVLRFIGD